MPITFDEVSAEIDRQPERGGTSQPAPAPAAPAPDPREQFERELRLHAERLARIAAD